MHTTPPIHELMRDGSAIAYYTTRGECDTTNPYGGYSLCDYTGDTQSHIQLCHQALARHFNIDESHIIIPRQTHSSNVAVITSLTANNRNPADTDAIVTMLPNIIIGVNTADCVPIVMSDSNSGVIGVAHAGWRGAISGVLDATVKAMLQSGADAKSIIAAMGPSICQNCFEVGQDVATLFDDDCVDYYSHTKPHVSLHKHIVKSLSNLGLQPKNILHFSDALCTKCHNNDFFSARKLGVNSGRVFTFIRKIP